MRKNRFIALVLLGLLCNFSAKAELWTTHFAYNNVTQIAMAPDKVYAISDGNLFCVDKQSEQITKYDRQSGLHGTGINYIYYDLSGNQLIIAYGDGKIDILSSSGVNYISELYNKDMTQRKTIYNITLQGRTAYLSTHYGIQTMDLRENKLVDSYWLRPGGQETPIGDVRIIGDSIYAFGGTYDKNNQTLKFDSLFCASLHDNIVDYTFWKREKNTGRIARDTDKGVHYLDETSHWYASGADGIKRITATDTLTYKPDGPLVNTPYQLTVRNNFVWMVCGGRWTAQDNRSGDVMIYNGNSWTTILSDSIKAKTGYKALDFMNTAVDPHDNNHYFITSYGTGLYEFQGDSCISHTLANGVIGSAVSSNPQRYTRLLGAHYDSQNRLWFLASGDVPSHLIVKEDTNYYGLLPTSALGFFIEMPADVIIDRRNENHKWVGIAYKRTGLVLVNDNGTPSDSSDDSIFYRGEWTDQNGHTFKPGELYNLMQDSLGRIWMVTDIGAAYIDSKTDFLQSDAIIRPDVIDNNGDNPITSLRIKAICESSNGDIWLGSVGLGVYVLNRSCTTIKAQYTTDNSALPSNTILSLASNNTDKVWIGTSLGLVAVEQQTTPTNGRETTDNDDENFLDSGSMQQWKLHLAYSNAQEVAATPHAIFAAANGALFSVDRADESIVYWNKAKGLTGTTVAHIAYDASAERMVIVYENGQIDLLNAKGDVTQMPDISMKAGSIAVTINNICVGSRYAYLAMPFGIVAINTRKGEVSDTYYIGDNAASVNVQHVVEYNDSLFAFSFDRLYKAALNDNLVDYSFWKSDTLPFDQIQQVMIHNNQCFVLAHDSLYRREGTNWELVVNSPIAWIHASGNQLLVYQPNKGLFRLLDNNQLSGLSNSYVATDAIYTNGEYWLAEEGKGLVRLGIEGDDFFRPEGPMNNFGYKLQAAHNQIYVAPGGRWATQYARQSDLSIYDGQQWIGIPWSDTWYYTDHDIRDAVSYAVDANDPSHFFVATYGTGVFEFRDYKAVKHYDSSNSTLQKAGPDVSDYYYTRTDGSMIDEAGNLWILNATTLGKPVHVMSPTGQWYALRLNNRGSDFNIETPAGIWKDRRNSQYKWMLSQRTEPNLILLDDKGTPTLSEDDYCMARNSFTDQNGNVLTPSQFRCFAQDHTNRIWVGTDKGILLIPNEVDFFTSNACRRIIIPRNDGTGLGDYLLGDEQINCLAVDGGNRMWIGTANSGLYLIEDDTITVAHFTEHNSLLPSNNVHSIAIMPKTGEVFIGTDRGIASYRSDASEAQENMSGAYAYPNPVKPDYGGIISITGLMDNTVVNIIDGGGNLVCKTKSHGGTAVWDGKLPDGRRATPGVYTAMCNANGGHTVVKILVIR